MSGRLPIVLVWITIGCQSHGTKSPSNSAQTDPASDGSPGSPAPTTVLAPDELIESITGETPDDPLVGWMQSCRDWRLGYVPQGARQPTEI